MMSNIIVKKFTYPCLLYFYRFYLTMGLKNKSFNCHLFNFSYLNSRFYESYRYSFCTFISYNSNYNPFNYYFIRNIVKIRKIASQTTLSGKENENVEDWLCLLEVNFKAIRIPIDEWFLFAATYLRESALKLYFGKILTPVVSTWLYSNSFLKLFSEFSVKEVCDELT